MAIPLHVVLQVVNEVFGFLEINTTRVAVQLDSSDLLVHPAQPKQSFGSNGDVGSGNSSTLEACKQALECITTLPWL